jgi:hypothetical protein
LFLHSTARRRQWPQRQQHACSTQHTRAPPSHAVQVAGVEKCEWKEVRNNGQTTHEHFKGKHSISKVRHMLHTPVAAAGTRTHENTRAACLQHPPLPLPLCVVAMSTQTPDHTTCVVLCSTQHNTTQHMATQIKQPLAGACTLHPGDYQWPVSCALPPHVPGTFHYHAPDGTRWGVCAPACRPRLLAVTTQRVSRTTHANRVRQTHQQPAAAVHRASIEYKVTVRLHAEGLLAKDAKMTIR